MRFLRTSLPICVVFFTMVFSNSVLAVTPDRIAGPIDSSQTVALSRSLHPKAQPQYDQGPIDPATQLNDITLLLAPSPSQQKALDQLLAQQQDPKSPNYRKWLTPQQFADRFGLSPNDINKITSWLKSQGLQVLSVGGGRNSVSFSGTAAQVESAFGTEMHNYEISGERFFANASPLLLPTALDGIVRSILGMHTFLPRAVTRRRGSGGIGNSRRDYYDAKYIFPNFLAPDDVATIYDIAALYNASTPVNGTGEKLAVVGQTDIYLDDIADFRTGFGLNPITGCTTNANGVVTSCNSTNFQYVVVGTDLGAPSTCGDLSEADLDIEWSGATARNAQIIFVNSPVTFDAQCNQTSSNGVNTALNSAINPPSGPPVAPVVSMSYGICEGERTDLETLLQQGNVEGVTIINSSGDVGAAACDFSPPNSTRPFSAAVGGLAVSYPASSPEVTGVGGTSISLANDSYPTQSSFWNTTNGTNGGTAVTYIPELPWNDDEELAQYCQAPASGDQFCSNGGGQPGWVAITPTSTAATVQSDIWISAGGGGASNCITETNAGVCEAGFSQPTWQQGLSISGAPAGVRYVPDVSFLASPDFPGYIICTAQSELSSGGSSTSTCTNGIFTAVDTYQSLIGGTSASTPVFAGIVTLLNQYLGSSGLGNINSTLYQIAANPTAKAFNKITSGDNNVYCQVGTPANQTVEPSIKCPGSGVIGYSATNFDATTGYNLVNGLGSMDVNNFVNALPAFTISGGSSLSIVAGHSGSTTVTLTPQNGFSGTVTFSCLGVPVGASCSFSPATASSGTTTATIQTIASMATGTTTITIAGAAGAVTRSTTVSLAVTKTDQSYTLAPSVATIAVSQGATGTASITMTPGASGFTGSLTYTCTDPASESTCTISPATATTQNPVTLSVTTTAATARLTPPMKRGSDIFYAALLPGLLGIALTLGSSRGGSRAMRMVALTFVGLVTLGISACGNNSTGSNSNPGTPKGTYTITVNATTGGTNPITGTTTVQLQVN